MNKRWSFVMLALLAGGCAVPQTVAGIPRVPALGERPAAAAAQRASRISFAGDDASQQPYGTPMLGVFAATANGNTAPLSGIKGAATGLSVPQIAVLDKQGRMWTCDFTAKRIAAFAPGAAGNVAPVVTIAGSSVPLNACGSMALGKGGSIYATSFDSAQTGAPAAVAVWPSGSNGNVAPQALYAGPNTRLKHPSGIAFDAAGRLYVAGNWNEVDVFAGHPGDVAPLYAIGGTSAALKGAYALAIDPTTQRLVVANADDSTIRIFAPGAHGNVAPVAVIGGPKTSIHNPYGVAVDPAGYIYVGNCPQGSGPHEGAILVFAPAAKGNAKPVQRIAGKAANLTCVQGLTVQ